MDLARTPSLGVRDLKHFMEFAERGPKALAEAVSGSLGDYESPFEQAVAQALIEKGWKVHSQIGASSFRIDLAVVDPDAAGDYLCGIECDGATYHRSATARDRDKLREHVLRGLGWEVVRIWSTDWWIDRESTLTKVHEQLKLLHSKRSERRAEERAVEERKAEEVRFQQEAMNASAAATRPGDDIAAPITSNRKPKAAQISADRVPAVPTVPETVPELPQGLYARGAGAGTSVTVNAAVFLEANFQSMAEHINAELFFEHEYDAALRTMIQHVIDVEAPVLDEVVAKRIARAHGWARTGKRILERVVTIASDLADQTQEDAGTFFWRRGSTQAEGLQFRRSTGTAGRSIEEISLRELAVLARDVHAQGLLGDDAMAAMAKQVGLSRLRASAKEQLEKAWSVAASGAAM